MIGTKEVNAAIRRHEARLRSLPGVRGVGIRNAASGSGQVLAVYVRGDADRAGIPDHVAIVWLGRPLNIPVETYEIGVVKAQSSASASAEPQMRMQSK